MKPFKRLTAFLLSAVILLSITIPVLSYSLAIGVNSSTAAGGSLPGGTKAGYHGYSIGLSVPPTKLDYIECDKDNPPNGYEDLTLNEPEMSLAFSLDNYFRTHYPVAEHRVNFLYCNGSAPKAPTTYYMHSPRKGEPYYQLSAWGRAFYNSEHAVQGSNVLGECLLQSVQEGKPVWDSRHNNWPVWLSNLERDNMFTQAHAVQLLSQLLQSGPNAAKVLGQFAGEAYAAERYDNPALTVEQALEKPNPTTQSIGGYSWDIADTNQIVHTITNQEVRFAAYLGLLFTVYMAADQEQREAWKPMISYYIQDGWEAKYSPIMVVLNSLMMFNVNDPHWVNFPEYVANYENSGNWNMYFSEATWQEMVNAGGQGKTATETLTSYWHATKPAVSRYDETMAKLYNVPFLDRRYNKGKWENKSNSWGVFEACRSTARLALPDVQIGAGAIYAPHITEDVKSSLTKSKGTNPLTVTPDKATVTVGKTTAVDEVLTFTPSITTELTQEIFDRATSAEIHNYVFRDGVLLDPSTLKADDTTPLKVGSQAISIDEDVTIDELLVKANLNNPWNLTYTENILIPDMQSTEKHTYQIKTYLVLHGDYKNSSELKFSKPQLDNAAELNPILTISNSTYIIPMVSNEAEALFSPQDLTGADGVFTIVASPKNKYTSTDVGTEVDTIQLNIEQPDDVLNDIATMLSHDKDSVQIRVKLSRAKEGESEVVPIYRSDVIEANHTNFLWENNVEGNQGNFVDIAYDDLIKLLDGTYTPLIYKENVDVSTLPVQYNYFANILIRAKSPSFNKATLSPALQVTDPNGEYATIVLKPQNQDYANYLLKEEELDNTPVYFSTATTQNFAELKQGSIGNEEWEAMAGVPTTENLYFAVGGDEFIVEATFQRKTTEAYTRKFDIEYEYDVTCSVCANGTEGECSCYTDTTPTVTVSQNIPATDYMAITSARVYQLTNGRLKGIGDFCDINGDPIAKFGGENAPSLYANITTENDTEHGRFHHTFESAKDTVLYTDSGYSDKASAMSAVDEKKQEIEDALAADTTSVVSDFIFLRTTAGDMPIFYNQYDLGTGTSLTGKTYSTYDFLYSGYQSSLYWQYTGQYTKPGLDSKKVYITRGGYNGNYSSKLAKYDSLEGTNSGDADLSNGLIRYGVADDPVTCLAATDAYIKGKTLTRAKVAPPDKKLKIVANNIDISESASNQRHSPTSAEAYYDLILDIDNTAASEEVSVAKLSEIKPNSYSVYGTGNKGTVKDAVYYDGATNVNSIVVHNPVSAEYAKVVAYEDADKRDQRVWSEYITGFGNTVMDKCPLQAHLCRYAILNCQYRGSRVHSTNCLVITETEVPPTYKTETVIKYYDSDGNEVTGKNLFKTAHKSDLTPLEIAITDDVSGLDDIREVPSIVCDTELMKEYPETIFGHYASVDGKDVVYPCLGDNCHMLGQIFQNEERRLYGVTKYFTRTYSNVERKTIYVDLTDPTVCTYFTEEQYNSLPDTYTVPRSFSEDIVRHTHTQSNSVECYMPMDFIHDSTHFGCSFTTYGTGANTMRAHLDAGFSGKLYFNTDEVDSNGNLLKFLTKKRFGYDYDKGSEWATVYALCYETDTDYYYYAMSIPVLEDFWTKDKLSSLLEWFYDYFCCQNPDNKEETDWEDGDGGWCPGKLKTNRDYGVSASEQLFCTACGDIVASAAWMGRGNAYACNEERSTCTPATETITTKIPSRPVYTTKLSCSEVHHATPTNWSWFTAGLRTTDGDVCKGPNDPRWTSNSNFGVYLTDDPTETPIKKTSTGIAVMKYPNGNYYVAKLAYPGWNFVLEEAPPEGTLFQSAKFSGSTLSLNDGGHYPFGDEICYDACGNDNNHSHQEVTDSSGKTVSNATFVNLDYGFKIYFPNKGDFPGQNGFGLKNTVSGLGPSYTTGMNTNAWTAHKYVTFPYNVIYDNGDGPKLYEAQTRIELLPKNQEYYDFYCVLANTEVSQDTVKFDVEATNYTQPELAQTEDSNYVQFSKQHMAYHSAVKTQLIDVVGRIGNLVMVDTDDPRYRPIFKSPIENSYYIYPTVPNVHDGTQRNVIGDQTDIRGEAISSVGLDTHGTGSVTHPDGYVDLDSYKKSKSTIIPFPLSPSVQNTAYGGNSTFNKTPLRLGYPMYMEVSTLGNYHGENIDDTTTNKLQIIPRYYAVNLSDGNGGLLRTCDIPTEKIIPVDVYMNTPDGYRCINAFHNTTQVPGKGTDIYYNPIIMNWSKELTRRMYPNSTAAINWQEDVRLAYPYYITKEVGEEFVTSAAQYFSGPTSTEITQGTNQALFLTNNSRVFNGTSRTYGWDKNPDDVLTEESYARQGVKWYFEVGLPSSAKFMPASEDGIPKAYDQNVSRALTDNSTTVILCTLEIKAFDSPWTLQYEGPTEQSFGIGTETYTIPDPLPVPNPYVGPGSDPYPNPPIIAVINPNKSSADDLTVQGTH